jgi:hypothetical protein
MRLNKHKLGVRRHFNPQVDRQHIQYICDKYGISGSDSAAYANLGNGLEFINVRCRLESRLDDY